MRLPPPPGVTSPPIVVSSAPRSTALQKSQSCRRKQSKRQLALVILLRSQSQAWLIRNDQSSVALLLAFLKKKTLNPRALSCTWSYSNEMRIKLDTVRRINQSFSTHGLRPHFGSPSHIWGRKLSTEFQDAFFFANSQVGESVVNFKQCLRS